MNLPLKIWLGFSITMILPIVLCPRPWETTALSVYYSRKDTTPGCCSSDWLTQMQQSWCPLLKLLILGLVTLPIYNVVLILVGWRLHSSSTRSEKHLVLSTRPVKYQAPQPPVVPPKPPPRVKRRPALPSAKRPSTFESVPYSSHMDPFTNQEPYHILRRNLQLVLRGLQNPPLEFVPPRVPEPIMKPCEKAVGKTSGIPSGITSEIPSGIPCEIHSDAVSLCPSEYPRSEVQKKRSKVIFKRLWQRWRSRNKLKKSKKSLVSVSSSSCSSTNASSCFYI